MHRTLTLLSLSYLGLLLLLLPLLRLVRHNGVPPDGVHGVVVVILATQFQ